MNVTADDPLFHMRNAAFLQNLHQLGWVVGSNIEVEYRFASGDGNQAKKYAAELLASTPDVVLTAGSTNLRALRNATRTVPIIFTTVTDPVGSGFVSSMARPGGNVTGFVQFEYAVAAKWLELLKQLAPRVSRVAVLRNPLQPSGIGQFAALSSVASSFNVELIPSDIRSAAEIEHAIISVSAQQNGGLIVPASTLAAKHRELIITLAARYRLPATYYRRFFVTAGGLISYGPDIENEFRLAAGYVDRILKGEKSADLPVQAPTKYELVINLKTAKALGLDVPPMLLARADEVIE
jgi:putative ABC transport system substrate-binding protein